MKNLFLETISPQMKIVLDLVMESAEFNNFILVGGTSLALQLGHRLSVDLDLFTSGPFDGQ